MLKFEGIMLKALVIDDDKLIRWSLTELFSQQGHRVDAASTAAEALAYVQKTNYQVIFADFELEESNTQELLISIQRQQPEAAIVILSALPRARIEPKLQELELLRILDKPFEPELIRSIMQMVRDRHTSNFNQEKEV